MSNMDIYEKVRAVPASAKKQFDNGNYKGTDINPMWRIKMLTEMFGPCGFGWWYEIVDKHAETFDDTTVIAVVDVKLYVRKDGETSQPICGTGGNTLHYVTSKGRVVTNDEGYKMALTDAISVACKALGIGADVYYEKDASSKYAQYYGQPVKEAPRAVTQEMLELLNVLSNDEQKSAMAAKYGENYERLDYATCKKAIEKLGGTVDE